MLTIFTVPKPFKGEIATIQRNAISSWVRFEPHVEVILAGDEHGVADVAREFRLTHLQDVAVNELGTPLLDSIFSAVVGLSSQPLMCYVNADIILLDNFVDSVKRILVPEFLLAGRRWDWQATGALDFSDSRIDESLAEMVKKEGRLHQATGIDYFVYPRHIDWKLPPFLVGRPGWDNWLIYRARTLGIPVIDATAVIMVIHQNHDYGHVPSGIGEAWEGPEADQNRMLAGGWDRMFTLYHATHLLLPKHIRRAWGINYLLRRFSFSRCLLSKAQWGFGVARRALTR